MAENKAVVINFGDGVVSSMRQHLAALGDGEPENYTVFRVPAYRRECNKRLYEPEIVSIGPYHHGKPAFKAMQMYKWQCLRDLLARGPDSCVDDCISMLRELEPQARQCYFEPVELDADEFVTMLLLDGCFVIESLFKWLSDKKEDVTMLLLDGCFVIESLSKWLSDKKEDAVCNTVWSLPLIRCDLFLLDNQIPFFIIERLFALLFPTSASDRCGVSALTGLLVLYITEDIKYIEPALALPSPTPASEQCAVSALEDFIGTYIRRDERKEIHHLLHVYYLCFVSTKKPNSSTAGNSSVPKWIKLIKRAAGSLLPRFCISEKGKKRAPRTIPCATALKEAGVTFTKRKDKKSKNETNSSGYFLDITFRNGILEIPFLTVVDSTRSRFANLIAFEQCMCSAEGSYMTSYAIFMDCIINTAKDVAILQDSGIIESMLASDEDLAIFFNQLCEGVFLNCEKHYLAPLFKEVREYCDLKRHKWRAKLMKDYLSSPWALLSVVAAIALLIFTFLQTFFTIFPYYHPRNN